jgi:signal transduction histidine kinase
VSLGQENTLPFEIAKHGPDTEALFSNVLLVEDEITHAKLIMRALKGLVGNVVHASYGQEAFAEFSKGLYELVLCDLNLPDIDGLRVVNSLREVRPGLPIIVMTASSKIDDAVSVMRAGAWDYMIKEFDDSMRDRLSLVITRTAVRKAQEMRELLVRSERDAFATAVRAAHDGVAVIDSDGAVVFANEAFTDFCGLLPNFERTDAPINIIEAVSSLDAEVAGKLQTQVEGAADALWQTELRIEANGEQEQVYYFEVSHTSIAINEEEDITSPIAIRRNVLWIRDITEKKRREKFQRDILSTTSHDLKGPLGAILTTVDILTGRSTATEKAQEMITRVGSCARTCVELIDDLLSARRIQDGMLVVRPYELNVLESLEDIVLDYEPIAGSRNIKLHVANVDKSMVVYADRLGFQRVLSNLVSNALKFTMNGGDVELSAVRQGNEVRVSVKDTGSGIEEEARPHLFDRYTRLDRHAQVEGTGLGLFVTKSIVDAHDGYIEVQSQLGLGTTFIITLPDAPIEGQDHAS